MPVIMAQVDINGDDAQGSGFHTVLHALDLTHITVERTAPSIYQTRFTLWVDSQRVYPTYGIGLLGEKSEGVIHHHPLPRIRVSKGQRIEFRFESATLSTAACPDQSLIVTLVADYVNPDEGQVGKVSMVPYVVESYKTESFLDSLKRNLSDLFQEII